jgi:hypothetical protein
MMLSLALKALFLSIKPIGQPEPSAKLVRVDNDHQFAKKYYP